jgi:hypothetical protein
MFQKNIDQTFVTKAMMLKIKPFFRDNLAFNLPAKHQQITNEFTVKRYITFRFVTINYFQPLKI